MSDPDPKTVREIDPRAELPQLQTHHTVYHAYAENAPGWDGEGMYADLETAQRYSAHMHVIFAWDADATGPLTWRHEGGFWDLLDNGQATGIIIAPNRVYAAPVDDLAVRDGRQA